MLKSCFADETDLLSILLTTDFYKNDDEKIIDEIYTMFLAGTKTVQTTTTNLFYYLEQYPEVKKKLLAEVDEKLSPISDDFIAKFSQKKADELEYLRYCFMETLRIEPPVAGSLEVAFLENVVVGGIPIAKGDELSVSIAYIHHHPKYWHEPKKFIPERFDPSSPYYKRPDGQARHPLAFTPFLGG